MGLIVLAFLFTLHLAFIKSSNILCSAVLFGSFTTKQYEIIFVCQLTNGTVNWCHIVMVRYHVCMKYYWVWIFSNEGSFTLLWQSAQTRVYNPIIRASSWQVHQPSLNVCLASALLRWRCYVSIGNRMSSVCWFILCFVLFFFHQK